MYTVATISVTGVQLVFLKELRIGQQFLVCLHSRARDQSSRKVKLVQDLRGFQIYDVYMVE